MKKIAASKIPIRTTSVNGFSAEIFAAARNLKQGEAIDLQRTRDNRANLTYWNLKLHAEGINARVVTRKGRLYLVRRTGK